MPLRKFFSLSSVLLLCLFGFTASGQQFNTAYWQHSMTLTDYANTTGLIALWRMDESNTATGKILYDYFGKHNGVIESGGSISTTGKKFRAIDFSGAGYDAVVTTGNADFVKNSTSTITIMFWMQRKISNGNVCVVGFVYNASGDPWCAATGNTNTTMAFWDGTTNVYATVGTITASTWYHYAVVINGSSVKIYWNGALIKTGTGDTTTRTNLKAYFSYDASDAAYPQVVLDEVSYWTRALADSEVLAVYNLQK